MAEQEMRLTVMAGRRVGHGVEGEFWVFFEKQLFPGEAMHGGARACILILVPGKVQCAFGWCLSPLREAAPSLFKNESKGAELGKL